MFDPKAFLKNAPALPGVYRMLGKDDEVLYVGKAKNLKNRLASYFQKNIVSPRIALMVSQITGIDLTVTRSEDEALLLENNLIKELAPRFNILFRDDKSYPYIAISKETSPKISFYRGKTNRQADYFGPFPSAFAVRDTIAFLQGVFRLRTCEEAVFAHRSRPCLLYQIKRCSAPCVAMISEDAYLEDVRLAKLFLLGKNEEVARTLEQTMTEAASALQFEAAALLRDKIQSLRRIQEKQYMESTSSREADVIVVVEAAGRLCVNVAMIRSGRHLGDRPVFPKHTEHFLPEEVLGAYLAQHYEKHAMPDRLYVNVMPILEEPLLKEGVPLVCRMPRGNPERIWVDMAEKNASLALSREKSKSLSQKNRGAALRQLLDLPDERLRIECFDISHTQGALAVASCVVYEHEAMKPSDYRRFNIEGIAPGDDPAAIYQAVFRRYEKLALGDDTAILNTPSLILIDGGKAQIQAAHAALSALSLTHLLVMGVAKGEGRRPGLETLMFLGGKEPLQLPPENAALLLIQEIRDEAHRFAITGHRKRRSRAQVASPLEAIAGIGPKRKRALMTHFGGLTGIQNASMDALSQVPTISAAQATLIYDHFHP